MARDPERTRRILRELTEHGWDALVVTLPAHVLLLSGYWPVIGNAVCLVNRQGRVGVLAPEDERELAELGCPDELQTYQPGSLHDLEPPLRRMCEPLRRMAAELGLGRGSVVGCESGAAVTPCSYAGMYLFGAALGKLLEQCIPGLVVASADGSLAALRAVLTLHELKRLRLACRTAEQAYRNGMRGLRAGLDESTVAAQFQALLGNPVDAAATRAGGFMFCMSGPNAAQAHAAYQRSRHRLLASGDLVLVHCNSYIDGFWTDVTRTFCLGEPDGRQRRLYEAVLSSRAAALAAACPGIRAAAVDRAARDVLEEYGLGPLFKHAAGHGVGFAAIDHNAHPRIHPASDDVLEVGMTFNIEPAAYIEGYGGLRHCDVVTVTADGAEVLTPFLSTLEELTIAPAE